MFYISASIYLVGCVIYWFWASGEVQPWSVKMDDYDNNENGKSHNENGNNMSLTSYDNKALDAKE